MEALGVFGWIPNQTNKIYFVLVDTNGIEQSGLGTAWTLEILKSDGGGWVASSGTKAEIGDGWYSYVSTAAEADTYGPLAVKVTHASIAQQNLEYVVSDRRTNTIEFTYTITSSTSGLPIEGVDVRFSTDASGDNVAWAGQTDAFGVARDTSDNLPRLDAGTYYVWRNKPGYTFADPDTEIVS